MRGPSICINYYFERTGGRNHEETLSSDEVFDHVMAREEGDYFDDDEDFEHTIGPLGIVKFFVSFTTHKKGLEGGKQWLDFENTTRDGR